MLLKTDIPAAAEPCGHYLTRETAQNALALATPMIEHALLDRSIVGSGFLYVVVMDPARTPINTVFEEAILHEHAFGDRSLWDADYAAFARSKARLSWRTGYDSHVVQHTVPHLLRSGDSTIAGGICLSGLVVAASGAFPEFDEVFAGTIALWLRALSRRARAAESAGVVPGRPGI